jgi:Domain of unknown function (DUF4965)/Domain of unknown function (DUF1793)/Domain of unknown function (DUF5127)/Domain of unknown function (DUF4964)
MSRCRLLANILATISAIVTLFSAFALTQTFRPPAVPLVTHDPYFSIWSMSDNLNTGPTRHWTGKVQRLTGLIRIDGNVFRWMGDAPRGVPPLPETGLSLTPTRTVYQFSGQGVSLEVDFLSPLLPSEPDVMSRPVTYITTTVRSQDGGPHSVQLLFAADASLAVDTGTQEVAWSRSRLKAMTVLRASNFEQPVLQKSGDDLRIDWGYLLLAVPDQAGGSTSTQLSDDVESQFAEGKGLSFDDIDMPRRADRRTVLASLFDLGQVSSTALSRHVLLAYDDVYSIEYLNRWMRPYWRRNGMTMGQLLESAEQEYSSLDQRARLFDDELAADLHRIGGDAYAEVAELSFRQTIAASKLVADVDGHPMLFPKEDFSNGCIATVDVIYPAAPFFLLFNPELLKAQLAPLMDYTETGRWRFPFAPHDLGTYPKANGQVYGGGERTIENQMPVEESGNMLLMFAALAKVEGNANYANRYWPQLQQWADFLKKEGMDPGNQLSTDDFAGHLAHNANLSIKAILALGGYSALAEMTGRKSEATTYLQVAKDMANRWIQMAQEGDHYRLAFDQPGTWSEKYNLVWDRILGLNLFPAKVAQTEIRFYQAHLNQFGLPLDNRRDYTKLDWEVWTATLADNREDFNSLIAPLQRFINESPSRVPLTDWYSTTDGKQSGFQARSVVGGVYIPFLATPALWKKWSSKAQVSAAH